MNEVIGKEALVSRVMARGLPERGAAEDAIAHMFAVVGPHLTVDEALALGRRVSPGLARLFGREPLFTLPRDEDVQVALHALGELLDGEMFDRLERVLPPYLSRHLATPALGEPPPYANTPGSDLATGQFGHSESIAKNAHPHEATKLSSARGRTA